MFITKLSILLLYFKVFVSDKKSKSFAIIHFLLWTNLFFYLATTLVEIFECTPRTKIWTPEASGKCININGFIISAAIINIVSDFSILMLLVVFLWLLQIGTKRRWELSAVFITGLL